MYLLDILEGEIFARSLAILERGTFLVSFANTSVVLEREIFLVFFAKIIANLERGTLLIFFAKTSANLERGTFLVFFAKISAVLERWRVPRFLCKDVSHSGERNVPRFLCNDFIYSAEGNVPRFHLQKIQPSLGEGLPFIFIFHFLQIFQPFCTEERSTYVLKCEGFFLFKRGMFFKFFLQEMFYQNFAILARSL